MQAKLVVTLSTCCHRGVAVSAASYGAASGVVFHGNADGPLRPRFLVGIEGMDGVKMHPGYIVLPCQSDYPASAEHHPGSSPRSRNAYANRVASTIHALNADRGDMKLVWVQKSFRGL